MVVSLLLGSPALGGVPVLEQGVEVFLGPDLQLTVPAVSPPPGGGPRRPQVAQGVEDLLVGDGKVAFGRRERRRGPPPAVVLVGPPPRRFGREPPDPCSVTPPRGAGIVPAGGEAENTTCDWIA